MMVLEETLVGIYECLQVVMAAHQIVAKNNLDQSGGQADFKMKIIPRGRLMISPKKIYSSDKFPPLFPQVYCVLQTSGMNSGSWH